MLIPNYLGEVERNEGWLHPLGTPIPTPSLFPPPQNQSEFSLKRLPHWHHQSQVREWQGAEVSPICKALFCQQNLGNSYWLFLEDIFWNFSSIRLKFDLDIDLSVLTIQHATGHFSASLTPTSHEFSPCWF